MKIKNNIKFVGIILGGVIVFSTVAFAINSTVVKEKTSNVTKGKSADEFIQEKNEENYIAHLMKTYGKSKDELLKLKSQLGSWDKVANKLMNDSFKSRQLTKERVEKLIRQGYRLSDIGMADHLSVYCEKTAEEILAYKTKTGTNKSKTWDDVIKELKIDTRSIAEKKGMPVELINKLKNQGLSQIEIDNIALLAKNFGKTYDEVLDEVKKGKKAEQIEEQYRKERFEKSSVKNRPLSQAQAELEKRMIVKYNITDEDIKKCNQLGIKSVIIVGHAKFIARSHNTTLDQVLELKKKHANWNDVVEELEGKK